MLTQASVLLSILVPAINNDLGFNLTPQDYAIKYISNDQNSDLAFHLFSLDQFHTLNLYAYIQLADLGGISGFLFEDRKNISSEDITFELKIETVAEEFVLLDSRRLAITVSLMISKDLLLLPVGNIKPIDYDITNLYTNTLLDYNVLLINGANVDSNSIENNNILLINNSAVLTKED